MNWYILAAWNRIILCLLLGLLLGSCTKMSESQKQARFLSSLNAKPDGEVVSLDNPGALPGDLQTRLPAIISDDRLEQKAVCGNGIIEGDEYCDRDNISHRKCTDFVGISGEVGCTADCLLDISRCITPAVDEKIGGIAETCKCTCNNDFCTGGCAQNEIDIIGFANCFYRCDNTCTCRCEGKTETHIEYCNITCQCNVTAEGTPQCFCNLDECEILTVIVPNIAELSTRKARWPLSR